MLRSSLCLLSLFLLGGAYLPAAAQNTITVRVLDGRNGHLISAATFQVRVDHQDALHGDWVTANEDGSSALKLPAEAKLLNVQVSYDAATEPAIPCDAVKGAALQTHWYAVSEIVAKGLLAPNNCAKPAEIAKMNVTAKPGEFVYFVRQKNWREQWHDLSH